jgi:hypothetical protein
MGNHLRYDWMCKTPGKVLVLCLMVARQGMSGNLGRFPVSHGYVVKTNLFTGILLRVGRIRSDVRTTPVQRNFGAFERAKNLTDFYV